MLLSIYEEWMVCLPYIKIWYLILSDDRDLYKVQ